MQVIRKNHRRIDGERPSRVCVRKGRTQGINAIRQQPLTPIK